MLNGWVTDQSYCIWQTLTVSVLKGQGIDVAAEPFRTIQET